jgi:hypothetical protein
MRAEEKALGLSSVEGDHPPELTAYEENDGQDVDEEEDVSASGDDDDSDADSMLATAVQESLNIGAQLDSNGDEAADLELQEPPSDHAVGETATTTASSPMEGDATENAKVLTQSKVEPELSKKDKRRLREAKKKAEAEAAAKEGQVSTSQGSRHSEDCTKYYPSSLGRPHLQRLRRRFLV